jgi:hypothetical protein
MAQNPADFVNIAVLSLSQAAKSLINMEFG